jgi:hypothetical protein
MTDQKMSLELSKPKSSFNYLQNKNHMQNKKCRKSPAKKADVADWALSLSPFLLLRPVFYNYLYPFFVFTAPGPSSTLSPTLKKRKQKKSHF